MKISIQALGFREAEQEARTLSTSEKQAVSTSVREASMQVLARVKREMPVDTGAARARWGNVWRELDGGMTIEQGAALDPFEYIERLNEGSSSQAPAGFLDTAAEWGLSVVEQELNRKGS